MVYANDVQSLNLSLTSLIIALSSLLSLSFSCLCLVSSRAIRIFLIYVILVRWVAGSKFVISKKYSLAFCSCSRLLWFSTRFRSMLAYISLLPGWLLEMWPPSFVLLRNLRPQNLHVNIGMCEGVAFFCLVSFLPLGAFLIGFAVSLGTLTTF